jgi:hypothetical protein
MTEANLYRCTPRQVREFTEDALQAGCVPMITGSPGLGKSSIMHQIADAWNLELIDIRLSTCAPEDMSGLPEFYTDAQGQRKARFTPFEMFPQSFDELPKDKDGWLIFYDEMNSGTKMVQSAAYKVVLDRKVANSKLHDRVAQAGAGNLMTDRAIVNSLSTAMQSRLVHIEMTLSHSEWMEDVAYKHHYDERIIAFLSYDEGKLFDFRPDHDEKTFCCPRTWEFMNRLIKDKEFGYVKNALTGVEEFQMERKTPLYAGTITSGVAVEFVAFCALQKELVTIKDVLADPENADLPREANRKWIVVSHLVSRATPENFNDVAKYVARFDISFKLLFFRALQIQQPALRSHPAFAKGMVEVSRHMHGKS